MEAAGHWCWVPVPLQHDLNISRAAEVRPWDTKKGGRLQAFGDSHLPTMQSAASKYLEPRCPGEDQEEEAPSGQSRIPGLRC